MDLLCAQQYWMVKHVTMCKKCMPFWYPSFKENTGLDEAIRYNSCVNSLTFTFYFPHTSQAPVLHFSHSTELSWRRGKGTHSPILTNFYKHKITLLHLLLSNNWSFLQKFFILYVLLQIFMTTTLGCWKSNSVFLASSALIVPCTREHDLVATIYHLIFAFVW